MQDDINAEQDTGIEGIQQCVALADVLGGLVQHMVALTDSLAVEFENYQKVITCLCDKIDGRLPINQHYCRDSSRSPGE